jgi:hypothetical protein
MGALAFAVQLLSSLPTLIQAGVDVTNLVKDSTDKLKGMQDEKRDPTPQEWDALNARIKALRDELHAPGS